MTMPFKVKYEIFDNKHAAPDFQTYDYMMARIEWNDRLHNPKGMLWRIEQTPMADGALTKSEEYLMLVYRVRKLWRRYFDQGRKQEVLQASLEQEKILDDWNRRTEAFMRSHPGYANKMDGKAYSFYVVVSEWRKAWRERKAYSKSRDCDEQVLREISKKCRQFEKKIDKYIKETLRLI